MKHVLIDDSSDGLFATRVIDNAVHDSDQHLKTCWTTSSLTYIYFQSWTLSAETVLRSWSKQSTAKQRKRTKMIWIIPSIEIVPGRRASKSQKRWRREDRRETSMKRKEGKWKEAQRHFTTSRKMCIRRWWSTINSFVWDKSLRMWISESFPTFASCVSFSVLGPYIFILLISIEYLHR